MEPIYYIDRETKEKKEEKVYGFFILKLFYGTSLTAKIFSFIFLNLVAKAPYFSIRYGKVQGHSFSKKKIAPFIEKFGIDEKEFLEPASSFSSFNEFFVRRLRKECRPIDPSPLKAVLPADGRYLVFPEISLSDGFFVKGQKFDLPAFLQDEKLAKKYAHGTMVIARLCPTDYHRFHFPCDCTVGKTRFINGPLYSVNPIALRKSLSYITENKRYITELESELFGTIAYIEIGATNVGTVIQTHNKKSALKGEEKGFFAFGGSCVVLLFEQNSIMLDRDLIENSENKIETLGKFGQSLGRAYRI